jgi:H/ACA ribonucleoprotein complex subunit 4
MNIEIEKVRNKPIEELLKFSIINIDKPSGPTSFSVSQFIKNSLNLNKTSHFGTLDPQVSGVLPVALGRACRLSDYFMHKDKTYVGIMRLHADIDDKKLKEEIKNFIGKITQLPPVRSRVKRAERVREIKSFDILERDSKDVLFSTQVQAGTYIRKLCDDMGKKIGGAHMLELRRTKAGIFEEKYSVNLYDFEKAVEEYKKGNEEPLRKILIPAEIVSDVLPVIEVKSANLKKLLTGKPLMKEDISGIIQDERFALFLKERFIGIYRKSDEGDIIARPEFIFN